MRIGSGYIRNLTGPSTKQWGASEWETAPAGANALGSPFQCAEALWPARYLNPLNIHPFPRDVDVHLGAATISSMLVPNHRPDMIMMTVPITKIVRSVVSQRGTRFAGFVMAWSLRDLILLRVRVRRCDLLHVVGKKWQFSRLVLAANPSLTVGRYGLLNRGKTSPRE